MKISVLVAAAAVTFLGVAPTASAQRSCAALGGTAVPVADLGGRLLG